MVDPKEQGSEPGAAPRKPDEARGSERGPGQGDGNAPGGEDVEAWHRGAPPGKTYPEKKQG